MLHEEYSILRHQICVTTQAAYFKGVQPNSLALLDEKEAQAPKQVEDQMWLMQSLLEWSVHRPTGTRDTDTGDGAQGEDLMTKLGENEEFLTIFERFMAVS